MIRFRNKEAAAQKNLSPENAESHKLRGMKISIKYRLKKSENCQNCQEKSMKAIFATIITMMSFSITKNECFNFNKLIIELHSYDPARYF